jgi:hypothetical protein
MVKVHLPIATDSPMLRRNMSHLAQQIAGPSPALVALMPIDSRRIGEFGEIK